MPLLHDLSPRELVAARLSQRRFFFQDETGYKVSYFVKDLQILLLQAVVDGFGQHGISYVMALDKAVDRLHKKQTVRQNHQGTEEIVYVALRCFMWVD